MVSQKELDDLERRIVDAFQHCDLEGCEIDFLDRIADRLVEHGSTVRLSEVDRRRLDQIFARVAESRDHD